MIIVFAKAPLAGQAKTRLIPRLGAWRAARLHERLTRHAVRTALLTGDDVEVHGTRGHAFFRSLEVPFRLQRGRDLGERMHRAFSRNPGAILIGTDCPELTPADLRRAARFLSAGYDAVLAPAQDGGYALIGLKKSSMEFFRGIAWSGERVYGDTVARLAGYRTVVIDPRRLGVPSTIEASTRTPYLVLFLNLRSRLGHATVASRPSG